jgi:hypothetical protein
MKEFDKDIKKIFWLILGLFLLFLSIRYWAVIEGLVKLGIDAAAPLIIGCVIAYAVNILMLLLINKHYAKREMQCEAEEKSRVKPERPAVVETIENPEGYGLDNIDDYVNSVSEK